VEWLAIRGFEHVPHTMLAELMQFDMLYWPIAQTEQVWHVVLVVMPVPVEYSPLWHVVHEAEDVTVIPDEYLPDWQEAHWLLLETAWPVE
jgi:hypothetical protein